MTRRLKKAAIVLVVLFAAVQFVRPSRAHPPIDPSHSIEATIGTSSELAAILDRSCGDCHSYSTAWPSYARVAPLSWLYAYGVAAGRKAVNFSEWTAYPPTRQRELLELMCQDVSQGKMPGSLWTTLRPEARLSAHDIETICKAAHPTTSR